jgi:hypothetical protein
MLLDALSGSRELAKKVLGTRRLESNKSADEFIVLLAYLRSLQYFT